MAERELGYIDTYGREEGDKIDHYPGALAEAERAAKNAHLEGLNAEQAQAASGTANILHRYGANDKDNIVLIPAPTADPQDPLNLPLWRRIAIIILLQLFASFGQSAVSAFASLEPFLTDEYEAEGKSPQDILNLSVMPTLTQGLANLGLGVLALAFGRRPIYLGANFVLVLAIFLAAAANTNYEQHLAYRLMMGCSVGVGQTLVPLMSKEIFVTASRGRILAWSGAINSFFGLVWGCFIPNVVDQIGWRNLYYVEGAICLTVFVLGIFLVPETSYKRTLESYNGLGYGKAWAAPGASTPTDEKSKSQEDIQTEIRAPQLIQITELTRPDLDNVNYKPRTWLSDLRPIQREFNISLAWKTFYHSLQMILFPNILILAGLNTFYLVTTIVHSATYPRVILSPPYSWARGDIGYVQVGGIIDIILTPLLVGYLSDWLVIFFAKRRRGVAEPEVRLLTFFFPCALGVIAMCLHGYMQVPAGKHLHWITQPMIFGFLNFAFSATAVGTNVFITEAYPTRAASGIILVNTMRGALAFAWMSDFMGITMNMGGPLKAWCGFGGIAAGWTLLVALLLVVGKKIRLLTLRFVVDKDSNGNVVSADT